MFIGQLFEPYLIRNNWVPLWSLQDYQEYAERENCEIENCQIKIFYTSMFKNQNKDRDWIKWLKEEKKKIQIMFWVFVFLPAGLLI